MKRILAMAVVLVLLIGAVAMASETGVRTFLGEQLEITIYKSISAGPFSLEVFYDHGRLNTVANLDGAWSLTKEPYLAANLSVGGGAWFKGTLYPFEEAEFEGVGLEVMVSGGVSTEYFIGSFDLLLRWDDGLKILPAFSVAVFDWAIQDTIESLFGKKLEETLNE